MPTSRSRSNGAGVPIEVASEEVAKYILSARL